MSLKVIILFAIVAATLGSTADEAFTFGCVAADLKEKGLLDADFPSEAVTSVEECRKALAKQLQTFSVGFKGLLKESATIKYDCVYDKLVEGHVREFINIQESFIEQEKLTADVYKTQNDKIQKATREVFKSAAEACDSDPTYAGIFDFYLGIKNQSLAVLQEKYCYAKLCVKDRRLIKPYDIDVNPHKINVDGVNCDTIVDTYKSKKLKVINDELKKTSPTASDNPCVKAFTNSRTELGLAFDILEYLGVSFDANRTNRKSLMKQLELSEKTLAECVNQNMGWFESLYRSAIKLFN